MDEDKTIVMFYSHIVFDSADPDKPIKKRMNKVHLEQRTMGYTFELMLHKLEMTDQIYSPFPETQELSYLSLKQTKIVHNEASGNSYFLLGLSNDVSIEKRAFYTIWDLLGEVGGFNDGLILVGQFLMGVYSAISFQTTFLSHSFYDSTSD